MKNKFLSIILETSFVKTLSNHIIFLKRLSTMTGYIEGFHIWITLGLDLTRLGFNK